MPARKLAQAIALLPGLTIGGDVGSSLQHSADAAGPEGPPAARAGLGNPNGDAEGKAQVATSSRVVREHNLNLPDQARLGDVKRLVGAVYDAYPLP